jgi:O-antigen/teichoic acid export membrane protein
VKTLVKEAAWVGLGQAAAVGASIVSVRMLTAVVNPAVYGELAITLTVTLLCQQVFMGPCVSALARFYAPAAEAGHLLEFYSAGCRLLKNATMWIVLVTLALTGTAAVAGYSNYIAVACIAAVFAVLSGYNSAIDGLQNAARQRVIVAWHQGLSQWLRIVMALWFVRLFGASSGSVLGGYCTAVAVVLVSQMLLIKKQYSAGSRSGARGDIEASHSYQQMLTYAWPFAVWGVLGWVQFSADRWALQFSRTADEVGFYAVLYQIGVSPMLMLSGLILQLVAPILYEKVGAGTVPERVIKTMELNQKLVYCSLGITLLGFVSTCLLHERIFTYFVAPTYRRVSNLLPWIALSGGLYASAQLGTLSLLTETNSRMLLGPKIGSALISASLYFIGGWYFGISGVVGAGLVGSAVYCVWIELMVSAKKRRCTPTSI